MKQSTARATLRNYHALVERQYKGDVDAIVALVDFATAWANAGLTARQAASLTLVYGEDLTQVEAAKRLGVSQQVLERRIEAAEAKIDVTLSKWAELEDDDDDS